MLMSLCVEIEKLYKVVTIALRVSKQIFDGFLQINFLTKIGHDILRLTLLVLLPARPACKLSPPITGLA